MNTFLIVSELILAVYAVSKSLPLIGFYDMKTCLVILFLAVLAFCSLAINLELGINFFISSACLAVALTSTYGIKPQKFPYEIK